MCVGGGFAVEPAAQSTQCSYTSSDINMWRSEEAKFQPAMSIAKMALYLQLLLSESLAKSQHLTNHR